MNKTIGERIRVLRVSKSLSQENIANELGLSVGAYSNIERGKTEISVMRLFKIARILKANPSEILDFNTSKKTNEVNEQPIEYNSVHKQLSLLNEKINEFQQLIENQKKEINYLKQIIELLQNKKVGKAPKKQKK